MSQVSTVVFRIRQAEPWPVAAGQAGHEHWPKAGLSRKDFADEYHLGVSSGGVPLRFYRTG